jgi:8-amino-7-oxononanoate synthase
MSEPEMTADAYAWMARSLATIRKANWYRSVTPIYGRPGAEIERDGRRLINFASNDYLGLAGDSRLIEAAIAATQYYGTGSTGSRLLSGHRPLHDQLEKAIATLKQTEDALVFSSGYLANIGAIAALASSRDVIFADQYNHSSLKNGAILSGATVIEYKHNDSDDLQQKLTQQRFLHRRSLILTDSVFSMDGDLCPLPQLLDFAAEFESMLLVDEAHATGVLGATGAGCVEHFSASDRPLIQVGTLSKALGSLGGYVAASATIIDFLRNRAPSWIYTTGLSPADTAAALTAIEIVQSEPQRRAQLWQNVQWLKAQLSELNLLPSDSPILCLGLDRPETAIAIAQNLLDSGIFAPAIRPPTVPTSRLRFTVMATHRREHLQALVAACQSLASGSPF